MDPADYAQDPDHKVFPETWWLPGSGTQRGTTLEGDSDPLTPNYPSTATAYRIPEASSPMLPQIPVHPIGYNDAYYFLKDMAGPAVPDGWQGGLNFTYHVGPGYISSSWKIRLRVTTHNRRANISDVFGLIKGSVEPDRYVLLGNHRDAWVFGGVDPTSATALMVELSRVTMELIAEGWKPRRSIVFCSWDAEEYGLIGSFEWVEEFVKLLGSRAVAYLNVDYVLDSNMSMIAAAMPTMNDVVFQAAKAVKSPHNPERTVYDDWLETFPGTDINNKPTGIPRNSVI
jgi:N-acetylated-alpha-linked acidic dipeptidase